MGKLLTYREPRKASRAAQLDSATSYIPHNSLSIALKTYDTNGIEHSCKFITESKAREKHFL